MTNQQMVTAIISAIQTQSNLLIVLQIVISNNLPNASTIQLQAICTSLGISTS